MKLVWYSLAGLAVLAQVGRHDGETPERGIFSSRDTRHDAGHFSARGLTSCTDPHFASGVHGTRTESNPLQPQGHDPSGAIEYADASSVRGWAVDPDAGGKAIEVHVYLDGQFQKSLMANEPRPDLVAAGVLTSPNHGFHWDPPELDADTHAIAVWGLNQGLGENRQLTSSPAAIHPIPVVVGPDPWEEVLAPRHTYLHFPDAPVGSLSFKGRTRFYLGSSSHDGNSYQAIRVRRGSWKIETKPTLHNSRVDNPAFDDQVWLYDVLKDGRQLRGWYHAEEYRDHGSSPLIPPVLSDPGAVYTSNWSIGYAESTDGKKFIRGGRAWTCSANTAHPRNQVITSLSPSLLYKSRGEAGAGTPRVFPLGDYYYMYYTDLAGCDLDVDSTDDIVGHVKDSVGLHVARASIQSGGGPGTWLKWYAPPGSSTGSFSEPGLGGLSTPVVPDNMTDGYASTPSVSWNTHLERYLMVTLGRGGIYMRASIGLGENGIAWGQPQLLMGGPDPSQFHGGIPDEDEWIAYPTLMAPSGEIRETGRKCQVLWVLKQAGEPLVNRSLVRREVGFK